MVSMENQPEKLEKPPFPGVAVDGTKLRTIREGKKLTQLYVASVVGVTTDTISRCIPPSSGTMRKNWPAPWRWNLWK